MKKRLIFIGLVLMFLLFALLSFNLGGGGKYDGQGFTLLFMRMALWLILVTIIYPIRAAMEDDDLEEDFERINQGNVAVAIYRGAEFLIVGAAAAVLVSQI